MSGRSIAVLLGLLCLAHAVHGNRNLRFLPNAWASSSSSVSVSSSSSSFSSTGSDGCTSYTKTSSSGGGVAFASGTVQGPCETKSESVSESKGSETATAEATAKADPGKSAKAIATALGTGDGVDVAANAVAKAVKDGDGAAIAEAVATSLEGGCKKGTKKGNCPADRATDSIVTAYASAENQADGLAYAEAIAAGLVSSKKGVPSVFASATAKILKEDGCEKTKPLLAEARAIAIADKKDREFVDALDFDIKIAQCLFNECTGGLLKCCALEEGQECTCEGENCNYSLFKDTPSEIWRDTKSKEDTSCICPVDSSKSGQ